ncbi:hypothetical protein TrRE_jg7888, partial [Triparma retinervis]
MQSAFKAFIFLTYLCNACYSQDILNNNDECKNLAQTTPERSVPQYSSTPKFNDPTNSAGWAEEGVGRC